MEKWCELGGVRVGLPGKSRVVAGEIDVVEHADFTGPCPGCLRKWGELNGHRLVLGVRSDHEGILDCKVNFDLTGHLDEL